MLLVIHLTLDIWHVSDDLEEIMRILELALADNEETAETMLIQHNF